MNFGKLVDAAKDLDDKIDTGKIAKDVVADKKINKDDINTIKNDVAGKVSASDAKDLASKIKDAF